MTVINCVYDRTAHYYLSIKNTLFIHTVINVSISFSRTKYFNFQLLSHLHTNYIGTKNSLANLLMKVIKNKSTLLSLRTILSWLFTTQDLLIYFPLIQCLPACIIFQQQFMSVSLKGLPFFKTYFLYLLLLTSPTFSYNNKNELYYKPPYRPAVLYNDRIKTQNQSVYLIQCI